MQQKYKNTNQVQKDELIERISKMTHLTEFDIELFATEDGYAYQKANEFRNNLKTTQLRKFFNAIKDIQRKLEHNENKETQWESVRSDFHLLKPQLTYARGRDLIPEGFYKLMITAMNKIDVGDENAQKKKNYDRFVSFFEAIVAYHKYITAKKETRRYHG